MSSTTRKAVYHCSQCCPGHECTSRAYHNRIGDEPRYCIIDGHRIEWLMKSGPAVTADITKW